MLGNVILVYLETEISKIENKILQIDPNWKRKSTLNLKPASGRKL